MCEPFNNHCEGIQKFRETGNWKYLCRNELDKACFDLNATSSDRKELAKRIISDQIFKDRADEIARNLKYDGYQRALPSMIYMLFDKKQDWEWV